MFDSVSYKLDSVKAFSTKINKLSLDDLNTFREGLLKLGASNIWSREISIIFRMEFGLGCRKK